MTDVEKLKMALPQENNLEPLDAEQIQQLRFWQQESAIWRNQNKLMALFLAYLPILICATTLYYALNTIPQLIVNDVAKLIVIGLIQGWLGYSIVIYTLHEVAAHQSQFNFLANVCRFFGADPKHYISRHISHHQFLGTEKDQTFTNFVERKKLLRCLLPGAFLIWPEYFVQMGSKWTKSKIVTLLLTIICLFIQYIVLSQHMNAMLAVLALVVVGPWVGQILDRARDFFEHLLLPADNYLGARNIGLGVLGWLIGGGPWGQPYHLTHHIMPSLPWYHQVTYSRRLNKLLRNSQTENISRIRLISYIWTASEL